MPIHFEFNSLDLSNIKTWCKRTREDINPKNQLIIISMEYKIPKLYLLIHKESSLDSSTIIEETKLDQQRLEKRNEKIIDSKSSNKQ